MKVLAFVGMAVLGTAIGVAIIWRVTFLRQMITGMA